MGTGAGTEGETGGWYLRGSEEVCKKRQTKENTLNTDTFSALGRHKADRLCVFVLLVNGEFRF